MGRHHREPDPVSRELISTAVFGCFDGLTSLLGTLAGLIVTNATPAAIITTSLGLAVAAAVGMAFGDYLAGSNRVHAAVMGVSTLAGSLVPAIPVAALPGAPGRVLAGVLVVAVAVGISELRDQPRPVAYATTAVTLAVASALSIGAVLAVGAL